MNATRRRPFAPPSPRRPACLRVEALEDRLVPAFDPVNTTTNFPFSAIVRIEAHFPDQPQNEYYESTGVMVDADHLLTAGHSVLDAALGGWADQVRVFAAQDNATTPYGEAYATVLRSFDQFIVNDAQGVYNEHGDLALVTLDRPLGDSTGWLGLGVNNDPTFFTGLTVNTAGYPAEQGYSGYQMYAQYGSLLGTTPDGALVDWSYDSLTTIAGQSGSPLWVDNPTTGQRTVYAILVSGDDTSGIGYAVRITLPLYQDVRAWESADGPPGSGDATAPKPIVAGYDEPATTGVTTASGAGQSPTNVVGTTAPAQGEPSGTGSVDTLTATWYVSSTVAGALSTPAFQFGASGWDPVTGDWDGSGATGIGTFDPTTATWYLRDETSAGAADAGTFQFGLPGWIAITGDWNGTGETGIGVYDPSTSTFYLRNEADAGPADAGVFQFGAPGWVPITGDWNGSGSTHVGVYDPATSTFFLRNENSGGYADAGVVSFGLPNWQPVTGNWLGGNTTTIGVVDPTTGTWYLSTGNSAGSPTLTPFLDGLPGWVGISGVWQTRQDVALSAPGISPPVATSPVVSAPAAGSGPSPASAEGWPLAGTLPLPLSDALVSAMLVGRPGRRTDAGGVPTLGPG